MAEYNKNLFSRLTKLFRSGPVIRRNVKGITAKTGGVTTAMEVFRSAHSNVYNAALSSYGAFDRMSRYSDFSEMEATPEISSALDIYSEECVSPDDSGKILHIYSNSRKKQEILEDLFLDTLNVEFNLPMWARNLVKYGDFFLFNDISPDYGVINCIPMSISEVEREEGFDPADPMAVRYRWITQGNQALENWQVTHFRLLGNDAYLPYGSSVLDGARRIWRQLILIEDAMLVYRVIRAPERRVFYIDVGNVPPEEVANYLEQAQTSLKRNQIVDKSSGKVDLRYNPMAVDQDYFLPVRGGESGTKIDTLAGGQNTAAVEDVEYIQKKLFAALKIPRAYLGYDEDVGSKATLAQEDIRFSRSIQRIQQVIIAELNKLAMIHLYAHGYEGEDLLDFSLRLNNPSSIAQQQKLELIRSKFEIAGAAPEGVVSRRWIRKNIIGLTDQQIEEVIEEREEDMKEDAAMEAAGQPPEEAGGGEEAGGEEAGGGVDDLFSADQPEGQLLTALPGTGRDPEEGLDDEDEDDEISVEDSDAPVRATNQLRNAFGEPIAKSRKVRHGAAYTHMPNFGKMTSVGKSGRTQDTLNQPFGEAREDEDPLLKWEQRIDDTAKMTGDVRHALKGMSNFVRAARPSILNEAGVPESGEGEFDIDLDILGSDSENE